MADSNIRWVRLMRGCQREPYPPIVTNRCVTIELLRPSTSTAYSLAPRKHGCGPASNEIQIIVTRPPVPPR